MQVVCETKDYLDEIILYNEMRDEENDENRCILPFEQKLFANYEYTAEKFDEGKKAKKLKRVSQEKLL